MSSGGRPTSRAAPGGCSCSWLPPSAETWTLSTQPPDRGLPTVASQLFASSLGLAALRDYCQHRDQWFEAIDEHYSIPLRTTTGVTKKEAVKALPMIRLVHGGNYGEWVKDARIADAGASHGGGLPRITKLIHEKAIHAWPT